MSMSDEHAEQLKNEFAVVCCRTEEGIIISAANLEDPAIFPDMVDSGLLTMPDNCLKIGQVIGAKLTKTIDSLTPLTPEIIEGYKTNSSEEKKEESVEQKEYIECCDEEDSCNDGIEHIVADGASSVTIVGGTLTIKIEEGKGIDIEIPFYAG
ncbi:sugar transporter [Clostridium sp. OS1-26]|uniref:sugar transporter n=1 Tax=Clostridium sp. OS1-26 TaxID=3070681 RepID=UPI0027DEF629|nr:sugar transporter [Clostridium sp. OS1-26]WML36535.1 sugar transporter [Clostridium sp. OS1-26]